ncbi:MAG TPA: S8 family serine peptidase [Polyangia bacterium]|jgi:serine protease|nr:S8 family serine peptidase [Polyangia bacterium]
MAMPRIVPWGVFAAVLFGSSALWHGLGKDFRPKKHEPTATERTEAAAIFPRTLLVDFRDDISSQVLEGNAYREIPISDYSAIDRLYRIEFPTAEAAATAAAALGRDPQVEAVDYDSEAAIPPDEAVAVGNSSLEAECAGADAAKPGDFPNDPCFRYQWHLRQVGAPEAWKLGQGRDVVVAVIDTGVSRVADLANTTFVPGYNFIANNNNAEDDHGHGTHVAGTIAQSTNNKVGVSGVAYGASIMPLKVLSARGSGSMGGIAQAIRWAADHGANVINMSLGGPFPVGTIGNAVKYARSKGVTVVAAAGNDGKGRVSYPARYPGVIAVAATQFDETTTFYSNWGGEIDIAAPGGNVRVDQNGDGQPDGVLQHTIVPGNTSKHEYLWFMGTSMASPHVAGVAALIVGAGVRKPEAVEQVLFDTARKPNKMKAELGAASTGADGTAAAASQARVDDHYGAGLVDAAAALRKVKAGRGAGELGIGCAMAMLGITLLRRRGRGTDPLGLGFAAALVVGSSGLFFLPFLFRAPESIVGTAVSVLSTGFTLNVSNLLGSASAGNPLVWSAIAPLCLTVLLYGVPRLRPLLSGLGFGIAGTLLFAAISGIVDVAYVPDFLDRFWLIAHAAIAALFATAVIRK